MDDFKASSLIRAINDLNKTLKLLNENIVSIGHINNESSEKLDSNLKSIDSNLNDISEKIGA